MKKPTRTVRYYDIYCDCCNKKLYVTVNNIKVTRKHKNESIYKIYEVCDECATKIGRAIQNGAGRYNQICDEMLHDKQEVDTIIKYEFSAPHDIESYYEYEYHTEPVKIEN